jgi:putative ABC transport system substrate-binding protein
VADRGPPAATRDAGHWVSERQDSDASMLVSVRRGLADVGYVEGRNVVIEYRFADGRFDRLSGQLTDLTQRKVSVIVNTVVVSGGILQQVHASPIPIVVVSGADPVRFGLAASMNRPGGNVTGVNTLSGELTGKQLGLLHDLVPKAATVAALIDPKQPNAETRQLQTRATPQRRLGRNCLSWKRAQPRKSTRNLLGSIRNQCS